MNQKTNKSRFIQALDRINDVYKLSSYHQFNWFRVMYKMTEEKNLHSRFIAFLLNPKGSHGQGDVFLKLFFEEFEIHNFSLEGVVVLPDEHIKKEEDNIDILITNGSKDAIIIENKIFAGDSNKSELLEEEQAGCTHKYQIPRYYRKLACQGFTVRTIIYLNVRDNKPSFYDEFPAEVKEVLQCNNYVKSVLAWIDKCVSACAEESVFKEGLMQYKQATTEFLNDYKLALDLQETSSMPENFEDAFEFWMLDDSKVNSDYRTIKNQFIHLKWHIVYDFYLELQIAIEAHYKERVQVDEIDKGQITNLTHKSNAKVRTVLTFTVDREPYYVCNDGKGFSIGRNLEHKNITDFKYLFTGKNYNYFDFSQRDIFELIMPKHRRLLIEEIVAELGRLTQRSKF